MMKKIITRYTRNIGWDYNTSVTNDDNNNWEILPPDRPYYVGTIRQVYKSIQEDRTFASIRSGNTYYTEQWFIKDQPFHINDYIEMELSDLACGIQDQVIVTIKEDK